MSISWSKVLPFWWAFFWRALLYGMILGGVGGFIATVVASGLGQTQAEAILYTYVGGFIAHAIGSLVAIKQTIEKKSHAVFGQSDSLAT